MIQYAQIVVQNFLFMSKVPEEWLAVMNEKKLTVQSVMQLLGVKEPMVS